MSRGALAEQRSLMPSAKSANQNAASVGGSAPQPSRRRALPATQLRVAREDRRGSGVISALLHILIIAWILTPVATHTGLVIEKPQGAGGPGPAGGGGGGRRGTGGV